MIYYISPYNIDERILKRASSLLKEGQLVIFPTDTNWIISCDPFSKQGLKKFYQVKEQREKLKSYSLLCDTLSRASEVAKIHNTAFRQMKGKIPGHYTFILIALKKIIRVLQGSRKDRQIGLRFIPSLLIARLLSLHKNILLSTQISPDMLGLESQDEITSLKIEDFFAGQVSLIFDIEDHQFYGPSTIVDLTEESSGKIIRQGVGLWP